MYLSTLKYVIVAMDRFLIITFLLNFRTRKVDSGGHYSQGSVYFTCMESSPFVVIVIDRLATKVKQSRHDLLSCRGMRT